MWERGQDVRQWEGYVREKSGCETVRGICESEVRMWDCERDMWDRSQHHLLTDHFLSHCQKWMLHLVYDVFLKLQKYQADWDSKIAHLQWEKMRYFRENPYDIFGDIAVLKTHREQGETFIFRRSVLPLDFSMKGAFCWNDMEILHKFLLILTFFLERCSNFLGGQNKWTWLTADSVRAERQSHYIIVLSVVLKLTGQC